MNGANALIRTLVDAGVDVCFMNPGTSEMHFVAALDDVPEMRGVLALFEGVATGAADGYARIAGKPAATLLHLGPGLGNGLANLHNARKAFTPIVNIVGDHATYHKQFDAQLESDIETVARNVSSWIRFSDSTKAVAGDAADAIAAAIGPPGQVATLVLPADVSWSDGGDPARAVEPAPTATVEAGLIAELAEVLRGDEPACLFVGGRACRADALVDASRIANAAGAKLLAETFPARLERGAGQRAGRSPRVPRRVRGHAARGPAPPDPRRHEVPGVVLRLPRQGERSRPRRVRGPRAGRTRRRPGRRPGRAGRCSRRRPRRREPAAARPTGAPDGCAQRRRGVPDRRRPAPRRRHRVRRGQHVGHVRGRPHRGAPAHDWLCLTGGAIGQGLPVAVGAAVAAPDRRVIALQADGSAMYTLQSWWTMARERLDVTTVLFNNSSYAVLNMELQRVGATAGGDKAKAMLDLHGPELDFVALATGMGVPATRATTCEDFAGQLRLALDTPGPTVIEAIVPSIL